MKSLIEYINESNQVELVSDGNERGFEYVDLGLPSKTMWATCNVGADKPEDEGLLFQFGCVDGYKYGDDTHLRTTAQNKQDTGSPYIPLTASGKKYKKNNILDLDDDAAHVNMGGKWKMPSKSQLEELFDNTTHDTIKVNGVKGMIFTSNKNGHQLFIPFAGYWDGGFSSIESGTCIWSSQVNASNVNSSYVLDCYSSGYADVVDFGRLSAFSVRGVFKK